MWAWGILAVALALILGMIDWAARQRRWDDVIALGRGIDPYLILHGFWGAWQTMVEKVLRSAWIPAPPPGSEPAIVSTLGIMKS